MVLLTHSSLHGSAKLLEVFYCEICPKVSDCSQDNLSGIFYVYLDFLEKVSLNNAILPFLHFGEGRVVSDCF